MVIISRSKAKLSWQNKKAIFYMKALSTLVILRAMQEILRFGFGGCFQHINKISLDPVSQNILHLLFLNFFLILIL